MAKVTDPADVRIGHWESVCCHLDLCEIKTKLQLEDVRFNLQEMLDGEADFSTDVWETKKEALLEIRSRFRNNDEIAEIDEMLAEL